MLQYQSVEFLINVADKIFFSSFRGKKNWSRELILTALNVYNTDLLPLHYWIFSVIVWFPFSRVYTTTRRMMKKLWSLSPSDDSSNVSINLLIIMLNPQAGTVHSMLYKSSQRIENPCHPPKS